MKAVSFFSGIGGFDLGFGRAGIEVTVQCEIEKNCRKLLKSRWPNAELITDIENEHLPNDLLRAATVFCGGFPCQDLSVAGTRAGLVGERSGLWFAFRKVIERFRPPLVVVENVPGLLSSCEGRDFASILSGLGQLGYCCVWRTLDSQYFGLAQRRKRVFIVASLGNYRCAEILFERESLCRDIAPSRETGQKTSCPVAGCSNGGGANGPGRTADDAERLVIAKPMGAHHPRAGLDNEPYVLSHTLNAKGGSGRIDGDSETFIPIQSVNTVREKKQNGIGIGELGEEMFTLTRRDQHGIAFSSKDSGSDAGELSPTLRAQNFKDSHMNGGGQVAVAFTERTRKYGQNFECQEHVAYALTNPGSAGRTHSRQIVRRLTPLECLRLQGFPDDWLNGLGFSDSVKYRMVGNAVSVPVAEWIARRILAAQKLA